ncbi:fungal-specific transcription factor domain-containing protein [Lentinula raphanica]|nr:fungal-specific transcription factor domain-containing protein [Lentinula raphanica]
MSTFGQEGITKNTRKRVQHSCDYCRRRKIKCDSAIVPGNCCSNCAYIGAECTHALPTKKRGPKNPYVQELEERIRVMSEKLRVKSFELQDQQENSLVPLNGSTSTRSLPSNPLSAVLSPILSDDFARGQFFGPSSGFTLMKRAYDLKTEALNDYDISMHSLCQRTQYWEMHPWEQASRDQQMPRYEFPDTDLINSLVSLYLVNVNIFFPIIHPPTLKRLVAEEFHVRDQNFGATVLLVCALGSRYSDDPRVLHTPGCQLSSGHRWFSQLAILYLIGTPEPKASWLLVALGLRFCCELGLHRRKPDGHTWTLEEEQEKRAFWVLVTLDKLTASFLGRPSAIHDEDIDADLPQQLSDEEWEDQEQSIEKPSIVAAFISYIRLCDILDFALQTLYSTRKSQLILGLVGQDWREKVVYDLDSSLNEWINSLPNYLRSDLGKQSRGIFALQSAFLYTSYYHLQIYIHRPFLSKPASGTLPSLSICLTAAKSCARVLGCQQSGSLASLPHTQYAAFAAGVILLFYLWANKRAGITIDQHREVQSVEILLRVLEQQETKFASAGRFWDMLTELKRGYDARGGTDGLRSPHSESTSWTGASGNNVAENEAAKSEHFEQQAEQESTQLAIDVWAKAPPGFTYNEWLYYIEDMGGMREA